MPAKKEVVKKVAKVTKVTNESKIKVEAKSLSPKRETSKPVRPTGGRTNELTIPVYSLVGQSSGTLELPKELFGVAVNKSLLSQAIRVYSNNEKSHNSNTKTRGEVTGSTRKIYRQKGTGRARHGGITAPIFVGGGIALGPKSRKVVLDLPKKMKLAALVASLSQRAKDQEVMGLDIEKVTGKTKEMANLMKVLGKKSVLIVGDEKTALAPRAVRNLTGVSYQMASQINVYEIIRHKSLLVTKEAVEFLKQRISKKEGGVKKTNATS